MLAIEVDFLTGRYHANPWGRHVNEGVAEWPPSPWRLLRALAASWRLHQAPQPSLFQKLISRLASAAPQLHLPPACPGHTRHYQPEEDERRLSLDAFTTVQAPVCFVWPDLILTQPQEQMLDLLLSGLAYFGRSESLARFQRCPPPSTVQVKPLEEGQEQERLVALFCPDPEVTVDQLLFSTAHIRKQRWSRAPGSRWVTYRWSEAQGPRESTVRLSLLVYNLAGKRLRWEQTLRLAHQVRGAILALGDVSPTLLGKVQGEARQDGHAHLHVLPDGDVGAPGPSRLMLWAAEGFTSQDLALLETLRHIGSVRLRPCNSALVPGDLLGHATSWRSLTPYLCARHPRRGKDSPAEQLRNDCLLRGLPEPIITAIEGDGRKYEVRRGSLQAPPGRPTWFHMVFPVPVPGPLCLGASSHFGMGRFVPDPS